MPSLYAIHECFCIRFLLVSVKVCKFLRKGDLSQRSAVISELFYVSILGEYCWEQFCLVPGIGVGNVRKPRFGSSSLSPCSVVRQQYSLSIAAWLNLGHGWPSAQAALYQESHVILQ